MDAELIDLLLTAAAAWTVFAIAGVGAVVLPWTASETGESARAVGALAQVLQSRTMSTRPTVAGSGYAHRNFTLSDTLRAPHLK